MIFGQPPNILLSNDQQIAPGLIIHGTLTSGFGYSACGAAEAGPSDSEPHSSTSPSLHTDILTPSGPLRHYEICREVQ